MTKEDKDVGGPPTHTFKVCSLAVMSMEGMSLYHPALKFLFTARLIQNGSMMGEHLLPASDRSHDEALCSKKKKKAVYVT